MSSIKVDIDADNKPPNFPNPEEILAQWRARIALAKAADPKAYIRGVSLVDASGEPYAWLKFGPTVTMAEARTQHYVAQEVNRNSDAPVRVPYVYLAFKFGPRGFIAMEYVDGAVSGLRPGLPFGAIRHVLRNASGLGKRSGGLEYCIV